MELNEAIKLLKNAVKDSTLHNQKHLDLTVVPSSQRELYQRALMIVQHEVEKGTLTDQQLKIQLGLIS